MIDGKEIYNNIKSEMKKQKINQTEIANILGVTRANISILFSRLRENKVSYKTIFKIAKILKCDVKKFF